MRINGLTAGNIPPVSVLPEQNSRQNFGHVIKTRFFEVLPDNSKAQIQDIGLIKKLCRRLSYHLCEPWKEKKNRITGLVDYLRTVDSDYARMPLVRRVINSNRQKDYCFYLITGDDAAVIEKFASTIKSPDKRSQLIERQWELVRDSKRRIYNRKSDEVALNIYLVNKTNPKSKKEQFYFRGIEMTLEKFFHYPYRVKGGNLH